jgi:hypothetical protein
MITSAKSLEIVMRLHRSRILTLRIPHSSSILGQLPLENIISNITPQQKPLVRNDRVGRERGALEQVEERTRVESLLSVV